MRISEVIDRMHLRATSPDGQVGGDLRGRYGVTYWIAEGHVERVGDVVGQQLAAVSHELVRERARVIGRAKAYTGSLASRELRADQDAEFKEEVARTAVEVTSSDGLVTVRALGVQHIAFDVRTDGADSGSVARAATEAAHAATEVLVGEIRRVQRDIYAAAP